MLFLILFPLLLKQVMSPCMELTEVSSKKNLIFTFTNKINHLFPKNYEYCMKISNKSAAIFMNNAIASLTVTTGSGSSKKNFKLKERKTVGYYFLSSEQENILDFKIEKSKSSFSVSFVSFPDECDVRVASNVPEAVISSKDYKIESKFEKENYHVCYFSGYPFDAQFSYDESIERKYSFKITSRSNILIEKTIQKDDSQKNMNKIAKVSSPALLEWDISKNEKDFFQIQVHENNTIIDNMINRKFNHRTKIHQILNEGNRTIYGKITYSLDKGLLIAIVAILGFSFVFVFIIAIFVLHKKGICCVKTIADIIDDSENWEIETDQDENEVVFRKPYLVENFENPYSNDKVVANSIRKESVSLNAIPLITYQYDINDQLIPDSN